jgi:hypothetical protein
MENSHILKAVFLRHQNLLQLCGERWFDFVQTMDDALEIFTGNIINGKVCLFRFRQQLRTLRPEPGRRAPKEFSRSLSFETTCPVPCRPS